MKTHFFIKAVGNGSGCGLVDDSQNFQTRDDSGIFGGLKYKHENNNLNVCCYASCYVSKL